MISRISGQQITDFIRENIWTKIGAEDKQRYLKNDVYVKARMQEIRIF
jgi:hypothetical protein